jgi:uncharacterized protein (DUF952 family)
VTVAEILHITERATWEAAALAGEYRMSTRGVPLEQEGFIHCSLPHQLRAVAEAVYADADDLVVLVIDTARLLCPVRYEGADGGEQYPHVYGPVPAYSVTRVIPAGRDGRGRLILPGSPAAPGQSLPGSPATPDQSLPGSPAAPGRSPRQNTSE